MSEAEVLDKLAMARAIASANQKILVQLQNQTKHHEQEVKRNQATVTALEKQLELQRKPKTETWTAVTGPSDEPTTVLVDLKSEEAKMVHEHIHNFGDPQIEVKTIHRVENFNTYTMCDALTKHMDAVCTYQANKMMLFHGTAGDNTTSIVKVGFKGNFQETNAYGRGTYFALKFAESMRDNYSPPDPDGTKHIFLSEVAVGDFCLGFQGDKQPREPRPQKAGCTPKHGNCDTTVNDTRNPQYFCVFNDAQARPAYLIRFTCLRP